MEISSQKIKALMEKFKQLNKHGAWHSDNRGIC